MNSLQKAKDFISNGVDGEFVYRHYGQCGTLLYVGLSNDVGRRLEQHKKTSPWANKVARTTVTRFETREDAQRAERAAIETEQPIHNSTYSFPEIDAPTSADGMSAGEFKAIRHRLRLTQAQLSRVLQYETPLTISTYERATNPRPVPTHVALLMVAYRDGYRPADWPAPGRR